ncbi:Protein of unknown function [Gryllus bimaculatus]|nr:Protein of unknown function [Gryllus bimaculatus]
MRLRITDSNAIYKHEKSEGVNALAITLGGIAVPFALAAARGGGDSGRCRAIRRRRRQVRGRGRARLAGKKSVLACCAPGCYRQGAWPRPGPAPKPRPLRRHLPGSDARCVGRCAAPLGGCRASPRSATLRPAPTPGGLEYGGKIDLLQFREEAGALTQGSVRGRSVGCCTRERRDFARDVVVAKDPSRAATNLGLGGAERLAWHRVLRRTAAPSTVPPPPLRCPHPRLATAPCRSLPTIAPSERRWRQRGNPHAEAINKRRRSGMLCCSTAKFRSF